MNKAIIFVISLCLFSNSLAFAGVNHEKRFWKKLDRDLAKQSKSINKDLRKQDAGSLEVSWLKFTAKNKLEKKYNVSETFIEQGDDTRTNYTYFATKAYNESFKAAVTEKISSFNSFQEYLETTGEGHKAKMCRFKRRALLTGGVTLLSMAVAGGVLGAILLPNLITGVAMTIRPVTIVFLTMLGVGAPTGPVSLWLSGRLSCIGE